MSMSLLRPGLYRRIATVARSAGETVAMGQNWIKIGNKGKGLVWDVPGPPARIYSHPTSKACFPFIICRRIHSNFNEGHPDDPINKYK